MRWILTVWLLAVAPLSYADTILIMGDSISAAFGIDKTQGWVELLDHKLKQECNSHDVRMTANVPAKEKAGIVVKNASVSGETTAGGLARLPALLAETKPSLVVLELGGNDGLRGLSPNVMQRNLHSMVQLSRAAGAKVVLLGIHMPSNFGAAYRKLFDDAYVTVAAETGVPFMPFFLEGLLDDPAMMQDDGIHPTAAAQPQLLKNAWAVMAKALSDELLTACSTTAENS